MGEEALTLTTRPSFTTYLHPSPRSISSAEGPARLTFGAADWLMAAEQHSAGACFAKAALASFHFTQTGSLLCGCHQKCSTETAPGVLGSHQKGESPHTVTHRGACPQFQYVCSKRLQRLHWCGSLGETNVSTNNLMPQSYVRARTFETSAPRVTDTM